MPNTNGRSLFRALWWESVVTINSLSEQFYRLHAKTTGFTFPKFLISSPISSLTYRDHPELNAMLVLPLVEMLGNDPSREQSSTAEGIIRPSCVLRPLPCLVPLTGVEPVRTTDFKSVCCASLHTSQGHCSVRLYLSINKRFNQV